MNGKDEVQDSEYTDGIPKDELTDQPQFREKRSEKIPPQEDQGLD